MTLERAPWAVRRALGHFGAYREGVGQIVGRLTYERLTSPPHKLYGTSGVASSYQRQGIALSKHFKSPAQ